MNFKTKLTAIKAEVWHRIQSYLPKQGDKYSEMIWEYPSRQGKYLRPGLVVMSCEMFGGSAKNSFLTAAAMQLSEEWLLIHDDFEDHSEERRSTATEKKLSLNKLYGDELAVNTGDALHVIMWRIMADVVRESKEKAGWKIYEKINEIILTATEGQSLELDWIRKKKIDITEEKYFNMVAKKTAYYTIIGPLQLGAIIAGASNNKLNEIEEWGKWLGYVFQLIDDVINLTSESHIQGKERGGDILEGKRTLILCHLMNHCTKCEKEKIAQIYAKDRIDKSESEKEYILTLMEKYGSVEYAREVAEKYYDKAINAFKTCTADLPDSESKAQIIECMAFIKNRQR